MEHCVATLERLGVDHDVRILSAHRTPDALTEYIRAAEDQGVQIFIAAAGGAAHLAGVVAAHTAAPVLAVPMSSKLDGLDSLLSMVQMPAGIPVGTLAIGKAGAINAALFAAAILAKSEPVRFWRIRIRGSRRRTRRQAPSTREQPAPAQRSNRASKAALGSSGSPLSDLKVETSFGSKSPHSFAADFFGTGASISARHCHRAAVSKCRQLVHVWRSEPHLRQVASRATSAPSLRTLSPQRAHWNWDSLGRPRPRPLGPSFRSRGWPGEDRGRPSLSPSSSW
jgi:5-(carboxyamino)imidazole ribonucleotide mutase